MKRREFIALVGATAALPISAHGQQASKVPIIAVLWHAANAQEEGPYLEAVRQGVRDLGYVEGNNLKLENRFPNEEPGRFRSMAADFVSLKPNVLPPRGPQQQWLQKMQRPQSQSSLWP
jgi:putative ABC transport system substrate-binding protein